MRNNTRGRIYTVLLCLTSLFTSRAQNPDSTAIKQVDSLYRQVKSLRLTGDLDSAIRTGYNLITLSEKTYGRKHHEFARCLYRVGDVLDDAGRYEEAEVFFLEMMHIDTILSGKNNIAHAQNLGKLGAHYLAMHNLKQAEPLLAESLALKEKLLGKINEDYVVTLSDWASLYYYKGLPAQALPYFEESASILKQLKGPENANYLGSMINIGNMQISVGQFELAEQTLNQIIGTFYKQNRWQEYANCLNGIAISKKQLGQFEEAEKFYIQSDSMLVVILGKDHKDYGAIQNNLASFYHSWGRYDIAEPYFLKALDILKRAGFGQNINYAVINSNLGALYKDMGLFDYAAERYLQCKTLYEQLNLTETRDYFILLQNLAVLYNESAQNAQAEVNFRKAVALGEKTVQPKDPEWGRVLHNFGSYSLDMKRYEEAFNLFTRAKTVRETYLGKSHPDYARSLAGLGRYYRDTGRLDSAEICFRNALTTWENIVGRKHPDYALSLFDVGMILRIRNRPEESIPYFAEAADIRQELIKKGASFLTEKELGNYVEKFQNAQRAINSLAWDSNNNFTGLYGRLYNYSLFLKGFLANGTRNLSLAANQPGYDSLLHVFNDWKALHRRLAKEYIKPLEKRKQVEALETQANTLEKMLVSQVGAFKNVYREITWQDVKSNLKPGEAALEMVHFNYAQLRRSDSIFYYALLIRPEDQEPHYIKLCEQRPLDSLLRATDPNTAVAQLYASRNIEPSKTANVTGLYPLLWQPLDSLLQGITTVYYSPSGLLHRVAFHAIPTGKSGEVLADRYRLYQLGSTRNLVVKMDSVAGASSALLAGGIRYDWHTSSTNAAAPPDSAVALQSLSTVAVVEAKKKTATGRVRPPGGKSGKRGGEGFNYLPGTRKEVTQLEKLLASRSIPFTVLADTFATEEQIKNLGVSAPSPAILHLATHGFFFPDPAIKAKIAGGENHFALLEHPLLRSGLALAGANAAWKNGHPLPGREDGILTAYEIAQLNLNGTRLAVLSACETGLGDIQGSEGVYGLQRAFKIAGVERLIVTLWDVPDKQTAAFMSLFYEKWLGGQDLRSAFYETQTAMRQRYKDPFVWAAFVLIE